MMKEMISSDFDEFFESVKRMVKFNEERKRITLFSNCFKIMPTKKINSNIVIGRVENVYAAANVNGEIIAEASSNNQKIGAKPSFLNLMEAIFDCEIVIDKNPRFIDSKNEFDFESIGYVFVPFEQLFLDGNIYPFRIDKENKDARENQLFYYTFSTYWQKNSRSRTGCLYPCLSVNDDEYNEMLKTIDGNDVYVLFYVNEYKNMTPVVYRPSESSPFMSLPILYGATFASPTISDEVGSVRCNTNDDVDKFCLYWRAIKRESGAIISYEWRDLERILEYSKLELKEG